MMRHERRTGEEKDWRWDETREYERRRLGGEYKIRGKDKSADGEEMRRMSEMRR